MSSKGTTVPVSFRTALSVLCLLLYSAGFIRVEVKFNDHEERLLAVEEVISQMTKHRKAVTSAGAMGNAMLLKKPTHKEESTKEKLSRVARHITNNQSFNTSANMKQVLEDVVTSSFKKICQNTGTWNVCPRGLPGPPGRDGPKGDKGDRGRRGKKGMMGQPGRSGKQGIMGPPGIRGEKGVKGDIGASGVPGMKGEQGESISAPKVTVSSSHLTVNESNTAALLCSVSGNPVPQVAWSRVGGVLPSNRTKVSSEGLLQINEVRLEDAGNYKCEARNILGREEKLASLAVQSQPKTSLSFGPSYVVKGKNITLPACHVTGYPSPKISWHKVPGNLVQARTVMKDGRLSIMNAYKSDSGLYKCEASNNLGHDSAVTQLNVVELPHFTVSPPSQLNVSTVQNITVPCQAAGDPQPTIMWRKEGGKLPAGRSSASADGTLKIWNLREREDSGRYTCVASSNQFFMAFSVMDVIIVQHKGSCLPVKVEDRSAILDARITASSYYGFGGSDPYYPYFGRLNENRGRGGWCPKTSLISEYLQIDMGSDRFVCGVATQQAKENQLTTSYKIRFSSNGATWKTYKENKSEKVFVGKRGILQHSLSTTVKARFVRFYPVAYSSWPCLRVEIFVVR